MALGILAQEPVPIVLPTTMLVFAAHGGYQFWAINTVEGDPEDPPVYFFVMESAGRERCDERFTDFVVSAVQAERSLEEFIQAPCPYPKRWF